MNSGFVVLRLFLYLLIIGFLSSCGVSTSSNTEVSNSTGTTTGDTGTTTDDTNTTTGDTGTTTGDTNTTTGDTGTTIDDTNTTTSDTNTTTGDTGTTTVDQANSIFDVVGAVLDTKACLVGDYTSNLLSDTSFDPIGVFDTEYGIGINSAYAYNADILKTEAKVYYSTLKPSRSMDVINIYAEHYRVTVDIAWSGNDDTLIYVKTPLDDNGLYGCYRYELNGIDKTSVLTGTKVYRNK
jgi:hypothetical protein